MPVEGLRLAVDERQKGLGEINCVFGGLIRQWYGLCMICAKVDRKRNRSGAGEHATDTPNSFCTLTF